MPSRRSPPRPARRTVAVCALAVALLLAGCGGIASDDSELPDGEEAAERFASVDVYNATVVTESTFGNETTEIRIERTIRPATGERYEETVVNGNRTITVSNGTTQWHYRPEQNEVTVIDVEGRERFDQTEQLRELFDSIEQDDGSSSGPQLLPIVPTFTGSSGSGSEGNTTVQTDQWSDPIEVSYDGVETVADREAHVVTVESVEGAERQLEQTLYFDAEWFVVLQAEWEVEIEQEGGRELVTGQRKIETIEFDPDVDEDIFEFEPPADATVSRTGGIDRFESYSDLASASDQPVPEPDVPADFEFEMGTLTNGSVGLQYGNGTTTLFVSRRTTGESVDGDELFEDSETIVRDGQTYYYAQFAAGRVEWTCGDVIYSVGGDLDREALLDVATSVQCPSTADG
jgi:outer membrane lipoprotein-sorting protein